MGQAVLCVYGSGYPVEKDLFAQVQRVCVCLLCIGSCTLPLPWVCCGVVALWCCRKLKLKKGWE